MMTGKQQAGAKAAEFVKNDMVVGLGTGSTVNWTIKKLGERFKEGLKIRGVATSKFTEERAKAWDIPLLDVSEIERIDLMIDGADEVSEDFQLIKGDKGALLREKMIANSSDQFIVVIDEAKRVTKLGGFPLPVEIVPYAWKVTRNQLKYLGCSVELRLSESDIPFLTDNGNFVIDCKFNTIEDPQELGAQINAIPGVVENGLFINLADIIIVGKDNKEVEILKKSKASK